MPCSTWRRGFTSRKKKPSFGHQELHRSHADVADLGDQLDCCGLERPDQLGREARRRRLFDDLLMPPLDRAVAATQGRGVAVGVGCDLHLHVAAAAQALLQEDRGVAEGRPRLGGGGLEGGGELCRIVHGCGCRAHRRRPRP